MMSTSASLPTSSIALPSGKNVVATDPRDRRISCLKGQKEGKLVKKLTKVGKKSAPVDVAVLVAGSLLGRSPTTMLAPTSTLKKRQQAFSPERAIPSRDVGTKQNGK
jgi:hypothetical protein